MEICSSKNEKMLVVTFTRSIYRWNIAKIKTDWKILSHCDGQAVKQAVEYRARKAHPIEELQSLVTLKKNAQKTRDGQSAIKIASTLIKLSRDNLKFFMILLVDTI